MAIVLPKVPRGSLPTGNSNREGSSPILTKLCGLRPSYRPQETMSFDVVLNSGAADCNAVEVSVIWFTQGKGTEDMEVHFFRRLSGTQLSEAVSQGKLHFETTLPDGPLSYRGRMIKIHWAARVRLYLSNGEESHIDRPFLLEHAASEKA